MKAFVRVWIGISVISIAIGLALLIIAAAGGVSWRDVSWPGVSLSTMSESYNDANSIDINIKFGKVYIKEGDGFHIKADYVAEDEIKAYVDNNGTWVIKQQFNSRDNIFGNRFSLGRVISLGENRSPNIIITIPKGFDFSHFNIDLGAGYVEVDNISTLSGKFIVGTGSFKVRKLLASEQSEYKVGAGDMVLEEVIVNNIKINCGVGNVIMNGTVMGDNIIDCGIGKVELNMIGNEDDYAYQIECGIGSVVLNDMNYQGTVNRKIKNHDANNSFNLKCGIGNITLKIKE